MQFSAMKHHDFYENLPRRARYNLSDACGATASLQDILSEEEIATVASVPLIYGSVEGRDDLRLGIKNLYTPLYPELDIEQITVLSGTEEGLFSIMACVLEPGDEVIGMLPCYPSLSDLPACFGGVFKPVELKSENCWQPSIEDFADQITAQTKAVIINSPHNPTGMLLDQKFVDSLIALCEKHDLYLISDDVFAFSDFAGIGSQFNVLKYEKAILANVLSKTFGLPGVRIGWVVTRNEELTESIRNLKTYNSICQSQLDEQVACFVMGKATELIQRNNQIVHRNIELFDSFVADNEFLSWHRPKAGMLGLVHSSEPLKQLLDSWFAKDVLVLPGELFGIEGDYFRVGFGKKDFSAALDCISGN
jgi:aspartate/methionine/tyrosine aminotransferase